MEQRQDANDSERRTRPARREESSRRSSSDADERRTRRSESAERRPRRSSDGDERRRGGAEQHDGEGPQRQGRTGLGARDAVRSAVEELGALTSNPIEGVVGIERDDDTWNVTVEVLEDAHIPSTSDILAEYEVRLSADGELLGYTRGRRYVRGRAEA